MPGKAKPRRKKKTPPVQAQPAPKLSPYRLNVLERQTQVFNLRRAGLDFANIARTVRPPYKEESGARYAFAMAMRRRHYEPPEELRLMERDRLDALQVELWKMAQGGSIKAHDTLLKLMKRRAELLGLDQPMKVEVAGPGGGPVKVREVIIEHDAPDDTPA
jgi:hypothetical protein